MNKTKDIVWQSLAWPSNVVHRHTTADREINGHGFVVGRTDEHVPFAIEYNVALTPAWQIQEVSIKSLLDDRAISLSHRDEKWYDGSVNHLAEFDGIEFVDISLSPFSNSFPIKRLSFEKEKPQKIDMIYFDENRFSLRKVEQLYSQLDDMTFRYQDVELPDFVSDIIVDDDGLVIDFSSLFRRV
jgi:uncharacterized protein